MSEARPIQKKENLVHSKGSPSSFFTPISISAQGLRFSGAELHALACKTW